MEDEFNSEQISVLEDLNNGSLDLLLRYIASGGQLNDTLKQQIDQLYVKKTDNSQTYSINISRSSSGRPKAQKSTNLIFDLPYLYDHLIEQGLSSTDAEYELAKVLASNSDYIKRMLADGRHLIKRLKNEGLSINSPTFEELCEKYPNIVHTDNSST